MLGFSESETIKPEIVNLKINNYLYEEEDVDKIELDHEENQKKNNLEGSQGFVKIKDLREIDHLEKSGILDWDGSDAKR